MAVLVECNLCHQKQSNKNKKCRCGNDMDKAKKTKKVNYWINYRHNGEQVRNKIGQSLSEAQAAEGKIKGLKYEKSTILDTIGSAKMTFDELFDWYLALPSVKSLKSYRRVNACLNNCRGDFGKAFLNQVKLIDLESYQILRKEQGSAPATIDMELKYTKTAVRKAFDNDKIDAGPLKAFNNIKKVLKGQSNARDRKLSFAEYISLISVSPSHLQNLLILAFNTGMRTGEIVNLKWEYIDSKEGVGKTLRDIILGHSLKGMDAYYIKPDDDSLKEAMTKYTEWLDAQLNELNSLKKVNEIPGG